MTKGVQKRKKIFNTLFALLFGILLINTVLAADVAYIYRKQSKIDHNVINVFENLGLDVDLIKESDVSKTNFGSYRLLYVGDERFSNPNNIPVNSYPSIISNFFYGRDWGLTDFDGVSQLASNNPLSVWINGTIVQVYTRAKYPSRPISIPYYYLDDENKVPAMMGVARTYVGGVDYDFGDVISYANAGTHLINGKSAAGNICFFGIIESDFWTNEAKNMFIDCIGFVGNVCSKNSDCGEDEESAPYCIGSNVYVNTTTFECANPNTATSMCKEDYDKDLIEQCQFGCFDGECVQPKQCEDTVDNDGDNLIDAYDPGCLSDPLDPASYDPKDDDESNPPVICNDKSDCGEEGFLGNGRCTADDLIVDDYIIFECHNPGTIVSSCTDSTEERTVEDCDTHNFYSNPYCSGNTIVVDLHNFSCSSASCNDDNTTQSIVEDCELSGKICSAGECITGKHDVALVDLADSINDIKIVNSYGESVLSDPAILSCSEEYEISVNVKNEGNYAENVTFNNSIDGLKFYFDDEINLLPGDSKIKLKLVDLNLTEGIYDIIVRSIIPADDDSTDNNVARQVQVSCPECLSNAECSDDYYTDNYCKNNDVYKDFHNFFCETEECKEEVSNQLVEDCPYSCSNGQCVGQCLENEDCSDDYYTDNVCEGTDIIREFHDFLCADASCLETVSNETVEECPYACSDGECFGECLENSDCSDNYYTDNYCENDDVYRDLHDFSCADASCLEDINQELVQECEFGCSNGQCNPYITCNLNSDCGKNGFAGVKYCYNNNSYQDYKSYSCLNARTTDSQCLSDTRKVLLEYCDNACVSGECVSCFANLDCGKDEFIGPKYCVGVNVFQDYKNAQCIDPATPESSCNLDVTPTWIKECSNGCYKGECINSTCNKDLDCDDNSVHTIDECNHPGTASSYCTNTPVNCVSNADCGINGFIGTEFCSLSDVYKDFRNSTCMNPGTRYSYCSVSLVSTKVDECGSDYCENNSTNYCKNGDVYISNTCHDVGCSEALCISSVNTTEKLVQDCPYGCSNGQCVGQCNVDTQCSSDFYSNNYCSGKNVVKDLHDFSCEYASCLENVSTQIVQVCPYSCSNGQCVGQCNVDTQCSSDFYGNNYCKDDSVVRDLHDFSCDTFQCKEVNSTETLESCPYGCSNGQCVGECKLDNDCEGDHYIGNYCKDDDVYREFHDVSCQYASCNEDKTEELVEECEYGCSNGQCVGECNINNDCSPDYNSPNYCVGLNIYKDVHDFSCANASCYENVTSQLVLQCPYGCSNGQCVGQCNMDSQCSSDYSTDNYCFENKVVKDFHDFSCKGLSCQENITMQTLQVCPNGCNNGQCNIPPIICSTNLECSDNDIYTVDECQNPTTPQSYCTHTTVNCVTNADCGLTGFTGNEFCSIDDVYKSYKSATCVNPGTKNSFCNVSIAATKLVECGSDYCENGNPTNYCKNGDVYSSGVCYDIGCRDGTCFLDINSTEQLVEECPFGCSNGQCVGQCLENSDCSDNYYTNNYCENDDVYRDLHDFSCEYASCLEHATQELVEQCEEDHYGNNFCENGNVVREFHDFSCANASCLETVSKETVEYCKDDYYSDNYCKDDSVVRDLHDFSCGDDSEATCLEKVNTEKVEDCKDDYSNTYCSGNNIVKEFHDFSCKAASCNQNVTITTLQYCEYGCENAMCKPKPVDCKIYAVQDSESANSKFFKFDPAIINLQQFGPDYPSEDFEGLDIHPITGVLYGSSAKNGKLYTVDKNTGAISLVGSMGCKNMEALSFRETDNVLWGWCDGTGLFIIDINNGYSTKIISTDKKVEGLAWDNQGSKLYATGGDNLYEVDIINKKLILIDDNLPGSEDIEALEMLPDGKLLGGMHNQQKGLFVYDLNTHTSTILNMVTSPFYDIEGIAWPKECGFAYH